MVSSSTEVETGGTFENSQNVVTLQHIIETGFLHQQPTKSPPIVTDNLTAQIIFTRFIKTRKSKTLDMIYHWLEDRISQIKIRII